MFCVCESWRGNSTVPGEARSLRPTPARRRTRMQMLDQQSRLSNKMPSDTTACQVKGPKGETRPATEAGLPLLSKQMRSLHVLAANKAAVERTHCKRLSPISRRIMSILTAPNTLTLAPAPAFYGSTRSCVRPLTESAVTHALSAPCSAVGSTLRPTSQQSIRGLASALRAARAAGCAGCR